jgi:hypothetical protein
MTDAERSEWNAILATGDEARIEEMKNRLLEDIHIRIMNDDPNYAKAGWKK